METPVLFYQTTDGQTNLDVRVQADTVWLNLNQLATLFDRDKSVVSRHLRNVFSEGELDPATTVAKNATVQTEGGRQVERDVDYYSLDVIISVGYRVKSPQGTQFRIWANRVLKEHLVKGYTLNENRLRQQQQRLLDIQQTLLQFQQSVAGDELSIQEAKGLLALVTEYAKSFSLLSQFDTDEVNITGVGDAVTYELDYDEALTAITELKRQLIAKHEASDLFGRIRDDGFRGILGSVAQTFGGEYVYPTIEEQAANLLYFIIKNHPFADGNKRIGAFMFVWFLTKNRHHLKQNNTLKINENALVALALLVAQSDPATKDLMVRLIMNLIKTD